MSGHGHTRKRSQKQAVRIALETARSSGCSIPSYPSHTHNAPAYNAPAHTHNANAPVSKSKVKKIKLALEIVEEILDELPHDYDADIYKYRDKNDKRKKSKILLGILFPDYLSESQEEFIAEYLADQISAYALPVKSINHNFWYVCFDL